MPQQRKHNMAKAKPKTFTDEQIIQTLAMYEGNLSKAAKHLTVLGSGGHVTIQLLRSWISRSDHVDLGEAYDRSKTLVKARNAQAENNTLRRDNRSLIAAVGTKEAFIDALAQTADDLGARPPVDVKAFIGAQAGTPVTVELLLSDLQIGKLSSSYNTQVARRRLFEYARMALFQIEQKTQAGYRIERIVLGLLGDIIESDRKHENSAKATDSTTAEQIYDAVSGIFEFVIEPLARLGIPMDIVGIAGNHDWDGHGLNMFEPGKSQFSWPLYRTLEMLTSRCGYGHVTWNIPEGSYTVVEFYGQKALYEHGVGVANTENAMKAHKIKRSEQEREYITYFRMGDKHTVTSYNSGQLVVNGAFFGAGPGGGEYSEIAGYASVPAQWMGFHVNRRKPGMLTLYDTFVIQLGGITA